MTARYRQDEKAPFTMLGPEATIVTPTDSRLHLLNRAASRIWELCAGDGATLDEIVDALLDEYEIDRPTATAESLAFLDDGLARGFLLRHED